MSKDVFDKSLIPEDSRMAEIKVCKESDSLDVASTVEFEKTGNAEFETFNELIESLADKQTFTTEDWTLPIDTISLNS